MSGAAGPRSRIAGFTLIELVVTLAIVAAAATLVLPAVGRGMGSLRLRSEANRVAALLRDARRQAVTEHRSTRVTLDRGRNMAALTADDPEHPVRQVAMPQGIYLTAASGGETLTFSSRGRTRDARWIVEARGGRRFAIDVYGITGRVTVAAEQPS